MKERHHHHPLLGGLQKGLVFVISAPAGTGKTTLVRMLREEFSCIVESISHTTRAPRKQEVDGRDYFFISDKAFLQKVEAGDFLEHANVFGNSYGTSRSFVENQQREGKHVVLVIDTQGALQLKGRFPAIFIFISPPNLDELRKRLQSRSSETAEAIEHRLSWADQEIQKASQYDYHIVNDHLKTAYDALRSIVIAEEHRVRNA